MKLSQKTFYFLERAVATSVSQCTFVVAAIVYPCRLHVLDDAAYFSSLHFTVVIQKCKPQNIFVTLWMNVDARIV